jgi:ATP-dependent helicase/nuclease subunit A
MDLLALGKFVLLPEDDLTLAVVLKGPLFGFTDNGDLFQLAYKRHSTLWAALKKASGHSSKYLAAFERLSELLARADYMPPYEFYAQLLGPEGARKDLLARLGQEADDPIDEFLSLTLDFEREHVSSLQGFLSWIEAGRTQIKRDLEQGRGEVRVMTIHGSKGLQGNIVFLPDTCSLPTSRHESKLRWTHDPEPALLWVPAKDQEESRTAALAEENKQLRAQEYRRLLYVAMTRARDRLYIGGWEGKIKPSDDCWYNLIKPAFKEIAKEVVTTTGESVLRLSNPQEEDPDGKLETATSKTGDVFSPPNWALRPAPPEPEPTTPLSPSRLIEDEEPAVRSPFDGDDGTRFKRGTVIHRLLEGLPNLAPEKWAEVTVGYLARPIHGLDADQQKAIAGEVLSIMEDPEFKALFSPGSLAEVPINGMIGDRVVSARIDRLAVSDEKIIIIDYKTNRPPPLNAKSAAPVYLKQMAIYRALLQKIYPRRKIACILAWTDTTRLMVLPDELLDQYAP